MEDRGSTQYYVLPEGASQEETCTWEEIEAFCRAGRLSPNSLIYLPDSKQWQKVIDTDLGSHFESGPDAAGPAEGSVPEADLEKLEEEYETALVEVRQSPDLPRSYLNAAAAALALGNREAAVGWYQQATELWPFNKSIAIEIKRRLRADEIGRIRLLERPESAWDDVGRLATFPLARGWLFFLVPAVALAALALVPKAGAIATAVLAWLWVYRTAAGVGEGAVKPPHWREFLNEPLSGVLGPVLTGLVAALELAAPFFVTAGAAILAGGNPRPGLIEFMQGSVAMGVLLWVVAVIYLPAVLTMAVTPGIRFRNPLHVGRIARAVMAMESEYLTSVAYFFGFMILWGGLRLLAGSMPVVGVVVPVLAGLYILVIAAFVLGRLSARSRHHWTGGPARSAGLASADPEQLVDGEN
jgi:hypothetical protein